MVRVTPEFVINGTILMEGTRRKGNRNVAV